MKNSFMQFPGQLSGLTNYKANMDQERILEDQDKENEYEDVN